MPGLPSLKGGETMRRIFSIASCLAASVLALCWQTGTQAADSEDPVVATVSPTHPDARDASSWDQKAAAAYLDQRAEWWMSWPRAARDHETFCVSCHTAVPYAMSRPTLRKALGE